MATVWVHFDESTSEAISSTASGKAYNDETETKVAGHAFRTREAVVRIRFERDSLHSVFIRGVHQNLKRALHADTIDLQSYQLISEHLLRWFGFLEQRGIQKGDWLFYHALPDSLRVVFVDKDGKEGLDQTTHGEHARRAILGSFFSRGSDFREPLVRSVWGKRNSLE